MVNADASDGRISAEIVDAHTGDALPGFEADDCEPVRGDRLRGRLSWSGASELSHDRPVRVRFTLENAPPLRLLAREVVPGSRHILPQQFRLQGPHDPFALSRARCFTGAYRRGHAPCPPMLVSAPPRV